MADRRWPIGPVRRYVHAHGVVLSALELMHEIQVARFPADQWNIYAAQASDGDNERSDNPVAIDLLRREILPICQYFAYIEVAEPDRDLAMSTIWKSYENLGDEAPAMRRVATRQEIYPVFRDLFSSQPADAAP